MKILIFGRGVIATQYAWALEKAGNTVEFYVRPGRAAQYGPTVNLEILDGRENKKGTLIKEKWNITMREDLAPDHDFDLIIVSVNHNQLDEAINWLAPRIGSAMVLIFNNIWVEPQKAIGPLAKGQIVWGFPGAGGSFTNSNTVKGGFMKTVFMGFIGDTTPTAPYTKVRTLLEQAGFSISEQKDMRSWLWFHFAVNVGIAAVALKEGSYNAVFDSAANMRQVVLITREMLPLIRARGGKIDLGTTLIMRLPAGVMGFVMSKAMAKGQLPREIMGSFPGITQSNKENISIFPRDAFNDAQKLGVKLPRLEALELLFKKE